MQNPLFAFNFSSLYAHPLPPRFLEVRSYFLDISRSSQVPRVFFATFSWFTLNFNFKRDNRYDYLANVSFERIQRRFYDCCTS